MTLCPFRNEHCSRGFTLLESVIVTGLSVVALIALVNLFFIFNSIYGYQQTFMATAGSASAAMNALEAAVLPAERVLVSHDFSGTTHASGAATLVLELPAVDASGNIIVGIKDYAAFYASSTMLYRVMLAGAGSVRTSGTKQLSAALSSLSFTYDDGDFSNVTNVIADIRTRGQFKEEIVESRLVERLYLRNAPLP